jgi:sulfate adenylyltransferase large subunit
LSAAATIELSAAEFLRTEGQKDLLRLVTAGSVDDGKSTLIGRLLYDSQSIYEDQLHAVKRASRNGLELALLTDGLRAEREQGITIDVAYRYFSTAKRKFILADTPGHEQYTRNMATGASNADLAILLVDASRGIQPQSKRHAHIIGLLGIRHLVVLFNKMDLVNYSEELFRSLQNELLDAIEQLEFETVEFFPVSAHAGTNVVSRSPLTPWYGGPALLEYLEEIDITRSETSKPFRFPVQRVQRTEDFRGYSGQIFTGTIARGDSITVLPSLHVSRVKSIVTFDGEFEQAAAPQSVTLTLEDEVDISRGDAIVASQNLPFHTRSFRSQMVWFSSESLDPSRRYLLKHTTQTVAAEIEVESRLDISTLTSETSNTLTVNDIGTVRVETGRPLFFDSYRENRATGSFIVIDPGTNNTVAAGMIVAPLRTDRDKRNPGARGRILNVHEHKSIFENKTLESIADRAVVLSKWNPRAAELLSLAGFDVLILDAPPHSGERVSRDEVVSILKGDQTKVPGD